MRAAERQSDYRNGEADERGEKMAERMGLRGSRRHRGHGAYSAAKDEKKHSRYGEPNAGNAERASRISASEAAGVAAIRIDIGTGSVYLRSCLSGTLSKSGRRPDFSRIRIIPPGLKRMLGASRVMRSGGQPCSPRARHSRRGPARS